ncbi:MAG: methionyl-tRNA formyltransferase [Erysipelotrichaceae bacterium]|jgi:methionyl-tRNA formyltransferase|nr:methionyl-tRNA formyltransferase [Erysipelotrichaceae bacterium]
MVKAIRILFFGTPCLAAKLLEALIINDYQIVGVITKADAKSTRSKDLLPTPTKEIAQKYQIPVFTPRRIKDDYQFIIDLKIDLIICISYGQIIPEAVLKLPRYGALNFHGSLLPKLRGAAPLQRAIEQGMKETGFTLMEMVKEMDAGMMYDKVVIPFLQNEIYTDFLKRIEPIVVDFALKSIPCYLKGKYQGVPQDINQVTFAPMLQKEEQHLSPAVLKQDFVNKVRAFTDLPGVYLLYGLKRLKIFSVEVHDDTLGQPGLVREVTKTGLILQVKDGTILIKEVQIEEKSRVKALDFYHGHRDVVGKFLT